MKVDQYDEQIPLLLQNWKDVKDELTKLFNNRDRKNALEPMQEGIKIFIDFLFLCNEMEPSDPNDTIQDLKWKPVNVTERLSFIKKRPDLYQSFIQLTELITEQEKQLNKKQAMKKVISSNA